MSVRDQIDTLYRDYQFKNRGTPDLIKIDIYDFLSLKQELGISDLGILDEYHGMEIVIEEDIELNLVTYEEDESTDDFYDGSEENRIF